MANLRLRRGLAGGLAALMLLQILPTAALASEEPQWETAAVSAREEAVPQLQSGTAVIPAGSDAATVKEILCAALISNYEDVDTSELEWEYFCEGRDTATGWATNEAWGSVNGFEIYMTQIKIFKRITSQIYNIVMYVQYSAIFIEPAVRPETIADFKSDYKIILAAKFGVFPAFIFT